MKHIKTFELNEETTHIKSAGNQTDTLTVDDHGKFAYLKQEGHQIVVDEEQAKKLVEILQKFIDK